MDYYKLKVLNNRKKIILITSVLIVVSLTLYYFLVYRKNEEVILKEEIMIEEEKEIIDNQEDIVVDIKGRVSKPGVYSFKESDNARIVNLIEKAGGLLKDADTSTINLSKKITDEMIIIIYSKNEVANFVKTQDDLSKKLQICENKLKNEACINEKMSATDSKININEASIKELEALSGIGKSKAEAIVEYRKKAKFKSIDEIMNVEGIGESIFANIKENITI